MPHTVQVIAGFDTHAETHHVAVISMSGAKIADMAVPATLAGYRQARKFIASHGIAAQLSTVITSSLSSEGGQNSNIAQGSLFTRR